MRPRLLDAPEDVVVTLAERLGSPVVRERSALEGFSQSVASWLLLQDGREIFAKAAPAYPAWGADPIRNGVVLADVTGDLGPRLLCAWEGDGWVVAVYEVLEGEALTRWERSDLPHLQAAVATLARCGTGRSVPGTEPFSEAIGPRIGAWQSLAVGTRSGRVSHLARVERWPGPETTTLAELEEGWHDALRGDALLHGDLRCDNFVREAGGRLRVVDWTHRWTGPGWVDLITLGPDLGRSGLDPQEVLTSSVWAGAPSGAVDVLLAGLAGYWFDAGHRPDLPHAPGLRPLQRAQGRAALEWLQRRLEER